MFLLTKSLNYALFNATFTRTRRDDVKKRTLKAFVYFLCISFLLMTNGFPTMVATAAERSFPIGEMVSKGEVNFEARENVWKRVEPSHFSVFQGVKIKTAKGIAGIALGDDSHIEVWQGSLFSFDQKDRLHLLQGGINFRVAPNGELNFKIGSLLVTRTRPLHASKGPIVAPPKNEETIGSILIHSNGSATVKSVQGQLSIIDQNRVVLASISSKDMVLIPSTTVKGKPKSMVAQVGDLQAVDPCRVLPGTKVLDAATLDAATLAATQLEAAASVAGAGVQDFLWLWILGAAAAVGGITYIVVCK